MKSFINFLSVTLLSALVAGCSQQQPEPALESPMARTAASCYTQQLLPGAPSLKYPLKEDSKKGATEVVLGYGASWAFSTCGKYNKVHTGQDLMYARVKNSRPSIVGTEILAAFDGKIEASYNAGNGWGQAVTLSHIYTYKDANKKDVTYSFTTNYIHITLKPGLKVNSVVKKGDVIATVANLTRSDPHLHFGIRYGVYHSTYSNRGALPDARSATKCACKDSNGNNDRVFPESFINPTGLLTK